MSIQTHRSTRADDEHVLSIIALRRHHAPHEIGRHLGLTSPRVRTICNRVLTDDLKHSGEDATTARNAYWSE
jgi:hypothetical protein